MLNSGGIFYFKPIFQAFTLGLSFPGLYAHSSRKGPSTVRRKALQDLTYQGYYRVLFVECGQHKNGFSACI